MKNRILIVDDDVDFVRLLRHRCESLGAKVFLPLSPAHAIELIQREGFDLLCIDMDFHGGSGWQVANHLNTSGQCLQTPAIVLTETDEVSSVRACSRIRAYYVEKSPTFWYRLKPIMQEFLELPKNQQPTGDNNA